MGLFKHWRKEKEYTLAEVLEKLKEKEYFNHIPVPTRPGSSDTTYWLREEKREEKGRQQIEVKNPILETKQKSSSVFEQKRDRFMSEVNGGGEYRNIPYDISRSHSTKPGRVVRYNDYQSARNYQKKYGQSR